MIAVVFPNSVLPSTPNAQSNANAFAAALWDFVRTLRRVGEDDSLTSDDRADYVDVGDGLHMPHAAIPVPTGWTVLQHPTLSQWAVHTRPLFILLVDVSNADTTVSNRAKRIRTALCSASTITRPSDGAVFANSFWSVDAATTLTRWNRLAALLGVASTLTNDWLPA